MYIETPYYLMDEYDVLITAEAEDCKIIDNIDYVELSVRRVWKGKKQKRYTIQKNCSGTNPAFITGDTYMLVANYTKNDPQQIDYPVNTSGNWCRQELENISYNMFSKINFVLIMFKYGKENYLLNNIKELIFTPKDPDYGLGKPLYDYRNDLFSPIFYSYLSIVVLLMAILMVVFIILMIPFFLYRYRGHNVIISVSCLLLMMLVPLLSTYVTKGLSIKFLAFLIMFFIPFYFSSILPLVYLGKKGSKEWLPYFFSGLLSPIFVISILALVIYIYPMIVDTLASNEHMDKKLSDSIITSGPSKPHELSRLSSFVFIEAILGCIYTSLYWRLAVKNKILS